MPFACSVDDERALRMDLDLIMVGAGTKPFWRAISAYKKIAKSPRSAIEPAEDPHNNFRGA